jgi:amino acid adenylation domain-containing protein
VANPNPKANSDVLKPFPAGLNAEAAPGQNLSGVPLLAAAERRQLRDDWNLTARDYPCDRCLHQLFEEQVERMPEAVAVVFEGQSLTYRELNRRANQVAHRLQRLGVGPEVPVAFCLERSLEPIVAILAILKAGGVYVPVDPSYPAESIDFILADSGVSLVITGSGTAGPDFHPAAKVEQVPLDQIGADEETGGNLLAGTTPANAAYIIYTSGSTGRPKGVVVTHHNVVRLFQETKPWFGFGAADVWTLFHSLAFDFSVWEMWGALIYGGRLVVVPYLVSRTPARFCQLLLDEKVTVLNQTPSAFGQLLERLTSTRARRSLRWVIFGGEALQLGMLKRWFEQNDDDHPCLVNMYGITETTVHVTWRRITRRDVAAGRGSVIGAPIPDLQIHLLDETLKPVGTNVVGEIFVGGAGVARGYLNRLELNRERFIADPFMEGGRLYRSGDLARRLEDGELEYLGRADQQVKVRGFRVEPGEIESVLGTHSAVNACAVTARADAQGNLRLEAFIVVREPTALSAGKLQEWIRQRLPEHMVPSVFVEVDQLPLTANGKLNRKALAETAGIPLKAGTGYVAPRNDGERRLCEIWQYVLAVEQLGIHDNFFELGGHSLHAMQVATRVERFMGVPMTVATLFAKPTIAELAIILEGSRPGGPPAGELGYFRRPGEGRCVHRLFEEQVERAPHAAAVEFEGQSLTYGELNLRANRLANHLLRRGVGRDERVALFLDRSLEMVVAVLAVLKTGAAYVPVDPDYPGERVAFMLQDSNVRVVLTMDAVRSRLPAGETPVLCFDSEWSRIAEESAVAPAVETCEQNLAYVIYTSGSTGRPKGVCMPHGPLLNLLEWQQGQSRYQTGKRTMNSTSPSFDVSFQEIFSTLCFGGTLVIFPAGSKGDISGMLDLIEQAGVDRIFVPFVVLRRLAELVAERGHAPGGLQEVITAGEQLQITPAIRTMFESGRIRLVNQYGPTETHVISSFELSGPAVNWPALPPIGEAIQNVWLYILDDRQQIVPEGTPGELYAGGVAPARGYLNQEGLTQERFIADPFSLQAGGRLYRTGDLVRRLPSGQIEFLGRMDEQVKIRGYRVELGEIESVLGQLPELAAAVVVRQSEAGIEDRLAAFVVLHKGKTVTSGALRTWLTQKLPDYMVPSAFYAVESVPLTPSGKVDRKALAGTQSGRLESGTQPMAPGNDVESQLCGIWQELLQLERVGIHDNFFELGGHSLLAVRVIARANPILGTKLSVRDLFERPTIAELARLQQENPGGDAADAHAQGVRSSEPPLSFAQERLWFLAEYEPESTAYHLPLAWRLKGDARADLLEKALEKLIQRHEVLRTTFQMRGGRGVQVIAPPGQFQLPVVDLAGKPEVESQARRLMAEKLQARFDLTAEPPIWASLFRLGPLEHLLLVNMHHIVSDGWSLEVFGRELSAIYAALRLGEEIKLSPMRQQYADYAVWQRQWLQGWELKKQSDYWRRQLANAPLLELPADFVRPRRLTYAGAQQPVSIPADLARKLAAFNRVAHATPFMSLLAAFQVLLSRHSRQEDVVVGTPIANRQRVETEGLIGFFVNTLVMRGDLSGNPSFREVVRRVRTAALDAFEHQDLPFEELVKILNPVRDLSRHPVFQVLFAMQNAPEYPLQLDGLETSVETVSAPTTHFDLELHLWQRGDGWAGWLIYNTDLFAPATIERMVEHYLVLLESLLADPGLPVAQVEMVSAAERQQLLVEWNRTGREYPRDKCVHELFAVQAERTPDAVALIYQGQQMDYRELNRRADQVAWQLVKLGVKPGALVGLRMARSFELIAGVLGVLKAGAAYLSLEDNLPAERVGTLLAEARPKVLLTNKAKVPRMVAQMERTLLGAGIVAGIEDLFAEPASVVQAPAAAVTSDDAAYVSYTSGSTGKPKGVVVPHRGVVRLVKNSHYASFSEDETFLQLSTLSFDASTFEIWGALLNGGRLVLMPEGAPTPGDIGEAIRRDGVTTLWLTAGLFHLMVDERLDELKTLRQLLAGGDVLLPEKVGRARQALPGVRIINGYGPTENTTFTCCHTVELDSDLLPSVPIGRPISNTQVYVLDGQMQPVPVGVPGELYAGGDGVALGYLNQPELTAERFVPDPFSSKPGSRLYRTGDFVRWRWDGRLEFLGRLDDQVKIRGFRVELNEVETALRRHPAVADAAVLARPAGDGARELAAWIVARPDQELTLSRLRSELAQWLPEYMIPSDFTVLDKLPLNANSKVDRKALEKSTGRRLTGVTVSASRNDLENKLCALWQDLLRQERVGIHDNFFDLGGHSLLAMRLVTALQKQFGAKISLAALFAAPTIAEMARLIGNPEGSVGLPPVNHFRGSGAGIPLFYIPGVFGFEFLPELIAKRVAETGRFYDGFEYPGLNGAEPIPARVEELAASLVPQLEKVWPEGPCLLAGYSFGGTVAFELARQLQAKGREVPLVVLLDSINREVRSRKRSVKELLKAFRDRASDKSLFSFGGLVLQATVNKARFLWNRGMSANAMPEGGADSMEQVLKRANQQYRPGVFNGKVTLVKVEEPHFCGFRYASEVDPFNGWGEVCRGGVEVIRVKGDHVSFLKEPFIHDLAEKMRRLLAQANAQLVTSRPS